MHTHSMESEFVDVIVEFASPVDHEQVSQLAVLQTAAKQASALRAAPRATQPFDTVSWLDGKTAGMTMPRKALGSLLKMDGIKAVYENKSFEVPIPDNISVASDDEDPGNWGYDFLDVQKFWELGCCGQGVRVGVLDTGINALHMSFSASLAPVYSAFSADGKVIPEETARDSNWHGTHVSAIIIGTDPKKARGVAPDAQLIVARVFDGRSGTVASVKAGLIWMRDVIRPDVINMSLGWPGLHPEWSSEISDLIDAGIIVCVASGNEYLLDLKTRSPGNYALAGMISVGAIDEHGIVWESSGGGVVQWPNDGPMAAAIVNIPTVVAPGVAISSAAGFVSNTSYFRSESGTSMACPHVAGLLALLLSHPKIDKVTARRLLMASLQEAGDPGIDIRYGTGIVSGILLLENLKQELGVKS